MFPVAPSPEKTTNSQGSKFALVLSAFLHQGTALSFSYFFFPPCFRVVGVAVLFVGVHET